MLGEGWFQHDLTTFESERGRRGLNSTSLILEIYQGRHVKLHYTGLKVLSFPQIRIFGIAFASQLVLAFGTTSLFTVMCSRIVPWLCLKDAKGSYSLGCHVGRFSQ